MALSWMKKIGSRLAKGFDWMESPTGQKVIAAGETAVEIGFPASAPVVALVNVWMQKAAVIEGKAQMAAELGANATGTQKATAAIAAVTPDVEGILKQFNMLPLSSESLAKINDAVLLIANELTPEPEPAAPPAQ